MNKAIGELELEVGSRRYVLRPTFTALADIEALTNLSIQELFDLYERGRAKATHTVFILYALMKEGLAPGDTVLSVAEFGALLFPKGITKFTRKAFDCIVAVLAQGREAEPEKKS